MSDIHSCSYYCSRPACVLAQRDELRDAIEALRAELAAARAECLRRQTIIGEVALERDAARALLQQTSYFVPAGLLRDRIDAALAGEKK